MTIIHRYLLSQFARTLGLCIGVFLSLFLVFDFFDRIDNFMADNATLGLMIQYYLFKVPLILSLMLPVATLVATMLTIGLMSKSSEITAMRAAGLSIIWIARPILVSALALSFFSILFNETVVPYATRRVNEINDIDIKQKDKKGRFSQTDFWWRAGNEFFSANTFDSRSQTMMDFSKFDISEDFEITKRTDAPTVKWVPLFGWSLKNSTEYRFARGKTPDIRKVDSFPLPISEQPEDLYDAKTDPHSKSFRSLRQYIKKQRRNGIGVNEYLADLNDKIAFPFITFVVTLLALPFALRPARTGSMATSFISGLLIGFSYYVVHSFSISMGRAEILAPFVAAWMANIVMGTVGAILLWGADAP